MVLDSQSRDPRMYEVLELKSLAQEAVQLGNTSSAVELYNTAITIVRALAKDYPDDPDHMAMLGALLYNNSNLLATIGREDEGLAAIAECERVYSRLPQDDKAPIAAWLADVAARRGMINQHFGYGASAVTDLQWAVRSYFFLSADEPESPHYLDWARVLSDNAMVLANFGDPDLAVASADTAIRRFFSQGDKINERSDSHIYARSMRSALAVAAVIHKAHGRDDISRQAADLGRSMGGGPPTMDEFIQRFEIGIGGERLKFTLTSALASARTLLGPGRVPESLSKYAKTDPTVEIRVIPLDRCGAEAAPVLATTFAEIAMQVMPHDPIAGLLLGQEAHYLFAGASKAQTLSMRHQLYVFGPVWARVLLACSQRYHLESPRSCKALALDLAAWASGAAGGLMPFAGPGGNLELRSLVLDCLEHHGRLLMEAGKETEGKGAFEHAARFAADYPKPFEA